MPDAHFDLAIIGSGSGNSLIGPEFADWRIAIIEESTFGGTCLNVGCIPTKMFVYPASVAAAARDVGRLGVDAHIDKVHWPAIRDRIFGRIDAISAAGRDYRAHGSPNVTLFETHAEFADPHLLALGDGRQISADRIVLAAGSRARIPAAISESGVPYHTSDTVMRLADLPGSVIIVGGGYISAEFAHVFSAFGVDTTVVTRGAQLLRHHDETVAERFTEAAQRQWQVRLSTDVVGARRDGDRVRLQFADGSAQSAELLLVATGRIPNSDRLNLPAAGVRCHPDGRVLASAFQRTTAPHIWALGDICAKHQLKHVANRQARVVAHNLAHPDAPVHTDERFIPAAVFSNPQVASVGLTEQAARADGFDVVTVVQNYDSTAYGWAMEDTVGFCKLIGDRTAGQLVGAHIMGEQASTLIQPLIQAMTFNLSPREMARGQYWIHPALPEVVENALLNLPLG